MNGLDISTIRRDVYASNRGNPRLLRELFLGSYAVKLVTDAWTGINKHSNRVSSLLQCCDCNDSKRVGDSKYDVASEWI